MTFKESLACGLQKSVGSLWKGDDYSDFTVVVEDTPFKCHRFILSACSSFFQCLFKSQMKEPLENHATLEGMTVRTFETITNALYTGTDGLNSDNVLDVWSAVEFLQINYLIEECHKFVLANITVDTCFRFLNHATLFAAQNVIDHSLDFISRHFKNATDKDNLLRLPFDHFYKVMAHDYLATDCEELAVDTVLEWVKYDPQSAQGATLDSENNTKDIEDAHDEQSDNDSSTNSLSNSSKLENIDADQALSCDITNDKVNAFSQILGTRDKVNTKTAVPVVEHNIVSNDVDKNDSKENDQNHHLVQLLSACRLFTLKPDYLDNVMKKHAHLLFETGAYTLLHEALMYYVDVSRRHDAWPEAAVYRASSSSKHVMVFLCKNNIMAYDLNTGSCTQLVKLPDSCESSTNTYTITIFDNILYLLSTGANELYMLAKQNIWEKITIRGITISSPAFGSSQPLRSTGFVRHPEFAFVASVPSVSQSNLLLPHGSNIYDLHSYQGNTSLYRLCCAHGHALVWSLCEKLDTNPNCLIRFHKYILLISEEDVAIVQYYNTETQKMHTCTALMNGTSKNMISFRHRENVYIIQRNGLLWKVFSTDETPVDFELVSKLWDFDCSLKGCVLYREKLFIFCDNKPSVPTLTKLPFIFTNLEIINIDSETPCLPMIIHRY
ncbi:hypothetical protein BsWGS_24335 [Bradybaena similaris]